MKDEFCEYLNSLKTKFVKETQKLYNNWQREKLENDLNLKSKIEEHVYSELIIMIKNNIPSSLKDKEILYHIKGMYDNERHIEIQTSSNTYKIKIPPNIYENKENKIKWTKIEGVKFTKEHFSIVCVPTEWQDVVF